MVQILDRLRAYGEFNIIIFGNELILDDNVPVSDWPIVDCLIAFTSTGFPLEKAKEYVKLRRPFCINDVPAQEMLGCREKIYKLLTKHRIPSPKRLYACRSRGPVHLVETEEYIEINGERMSKPLVEKPYNADDHNVYIYYGFGKGSRRLFRKIKNLSSQYYPNVHALRTDGDYIYEQFLKGGK